MKTIFSFKITTHLGLFVGTLAGASIIGSTAAALGGVTGTVIAAVVCALAGFAWYHLQTYLDSKNRPQEVVNTPLEKAEISADRLDPLTGLANLNGLNAWLSEKASRLSQDNKAIIVLTADLADFDQLVKLRGIEQANAVLIEVAKRVSPFAGDDGIAARIDGDEFAAIATVVPNLSHEMAAEMAGKLTEMIQRPVELPNGVIWIGGSVGAAVGRPLEGNAVFERSKKALEKAKKIGRGHYFVDYTSVETPN